MRENAQTLPGTRDWLGEDMIRRQKVIRLIQEAYESFGFSPLGTPAMEYQEILYTDASDTAREIFEVNVRSRHASAGSTEKPLGLRYDHTVPLARVVAQHSSLLPLPFRRYAVGPVWRAEKPQKGRLREFWQADADIVGAFGARVDAEIVALLDCVVRKLGITNYEVIINDRALLDAVVDGLGLCGNELAFEVFRAWDKLEKFDRASIESDLKGVMSAEQSDRVLDFTYSFLLGLNGPNEEKLKAIEDHFRTERVAEAVLKVRRLLEMISFLGVPEERTTFLPSLARGFAYYTGPIFEIRSPEVGVGSFAGGGRFDHLIKDLGGPDLPATGASFGLERLIEVLMSMGLLGNRCSAADLLITIVPPHNSDLVNWALQLAGQCRELGYNADVYGGDEGLKRQLAYGHKLGIPVTLILGETELQAREVIVRDMLADISGQKNREANQVRVCETELPDTLRRILSR